VGFDRERPGEGILHSVEGRVSGDEIVYDFIDQFRPVFRHALISYINSGKLIPIRWNRNNNKGTKDNEAHFYRR